MSKKYKEELDKIVMSKDMKRRILHNVLNENIEADSIAISKEKKYNNFKRNMQMAAACFATIVCLSIVKNYPEFFNHENSNFEQNQVIKDSSNKNEVVKNSQESESNNINENGTNDNKEIERSQAVNPDNSTNENYKKDNQIKDNGNNNLNENKDSSKIEQNEKSSIDSSVNFDESKKKQTPQSDANNAAIKFESSGSNSKEVTKSKEEQTSKNKENNNLENPSLEVCVSPIKEYKTLEEAEDAVKIKINPVKVLPKDFNIDSVSVISNEIIQIQYSNGQDQIIFRAGKNIDNISGDYNTYEIKNILKVNGAEVDLEGNKDKIFNLATWKKDNISYSISSTNGIDEEDMLNMIKSN